MSFDVVGLLNRSLPELYDFIVKSTDFRPPAALPAKIILPTEYFPLEDSEWQKLIDEFVVVLEEFLGSKHTSLSIVEEWEKSRPELVKEPDIRKYLEKSGFWPYCYEYFCSFQQFRDQIQDQLGRRPYATPGVKYRWYIKFQVLARCEN